MIVGTLTIVEPNDESSPMPRIELLRRAAAGVSEALVRSYLPPGHPDAPPGGAYRSLVRSSESSMEYLEHLLPAARRPLNRRQGR